jgi:hypothetical protein
MNISKHLNGNKLLFDSMGTSFLITDIVAV